MKAAFILAALFLAPATASFGLLAAQNSAADPIVVSTQHPRLFLRAQRLRLLRREKDRNSARWVNLQALIRDNAPMPEPGFEQALYFEVSGEREIGRKAVVWALGPATDLRQLALVYDWCQDLLSEQEKHTLAAKLEKAIAAPPANDSVGVAAARAMAAVALFDEVPQTPGRELERLVRTWWAGKIVPALKSGQHIISREDAFPLYELFHAVQDNANIDLRESVPRFFKEYPIEHLISYYPLPYPGPENQYFIGAAAHVGEPDLKQAALSRVAELSMVAYDTNGPESQVLQGWLMHDKYLLRGTFSAPYEFLWANPYQPGLSYYHVPMIYYAPEYGRLFVRSSWDDTADWFGAFDGVLQKMGDGGPVLIDPRKPTPPMAMKEATIYFAGAASKFQLNLEEPQPVFLMGLEPKRTYRIEVDDEEMYEDSTDQAGTLEIDNMPAHRAIGIRIGVVAPAAAGQ